MTNLLAQADQASSVTHELQHFLTNVRVVKTKPNAFRRLAKIVSNYYEKLWRIHFTQFTIQFFFVIVSIIFLGAVIVPLVSDVSTVRTFLSGKATYGHSLIIGQLVSTVLAAVLAVIGVIKLNSSRLRAFEWFRRSTLVNLLLTEFFIFSREQFAAMGSFVLTVILLLLINTILGHEQRIRSS